MHSNLAAKYNFNEGSKEFPNVLGSHVTEDRLTAPNIGKGGRRWKR